jgi:1,2-phenylacetyl-CoA epoxidase catalytic subunit
VYRGIAHIKSIEVEGDVQFIEELEVEVKESHEVSQHFSAFVKRFLKQRRLHKETAQELLNRVWLKIEEVLQMVINLNHLKSL